MPRTLCKTWASLFAKFVNGKTWHCRVYEYRVTVSCNPTRDLAKGFLLQRYYSRRAVARKIWPQLLSVGLVYFVTLNLVPGIAMEIQSCRFREWMPLILFTNFTATDFLGRMITPWFYRVTSYQILLVALLRFILVPLVSFCIMPEFSLFYNEPFWPQLFITILG